MTVFVKNLSIVVNSGQKGESELPKSANQKSQGQGVEPAQIQRTGAASLLMQGFWQGVGSSLGAVVFGAAISCFICGALHMFTALPLESDTRQIQMRDRYAHYRGMAVGAPQAELVDRHLRQLMNSIQLR